MVLLGCYTPSLPLKSLGEEGSLAERAEPALERTEPERTLTQAIRDVNQPTIFELEDALQSTLMPYLAIATAFQEILATSVTAKTLLLLTSRPQFDRTATPVVSEPAQSSTSQSCHIAKLPSRTPSNADAFLDVIEV